MPTQQSPQFGNRKFFNTIQIMEDLVDRVFRKHHFTPITSSSTSTVRLASMEDFPVMEELLEVA